LTLLVFVLGAAALLSLRNRSSWFPRILIGQAVVAIAIYLLDFSGIGGPRPPPGPMVLGLAALALAVVELVIASSPLTARTQAATAA
jgi:hypothetical protein